MTPFRVMAIIAAICVALSLVPVLRSSPTTQQSLQRSQLIAIIVLICAIAGGIFLFANVYFKLFPFLR